jgi:molybdopterin molybdotransferase
MRFDTILIVDWSAKSVPSPAAPSADAIWIGISRDGEIRASEYFRTRAAALDRIGALCADELSEGRRILVGFDFPFGYPAGFAERLTGRPRALAVWDHLAERVDDGPANANNRFEVAAEINSRFDGGPFWGRPRTSPVSLPEGKAASARAVFPEFRRVETRTKGAKSCWQLNGAGSVGGQALVGIAALARLRRDPRLAGSVEVWPFDRGLRPPETRLVLAEVYPSLLAGAVRDATNGESVKDEIQVRLLAGAFAALDARDGLEALFSPEVDPETRAAVEAEEGWILGAGFDDALRAAARPAPPPLRNDCFALPPGVDWVPVDLALAKLRDGLSVRTGIESVPVGAAGGRILAEPLVAKRANPPRANSAVDGYGFAHGALGEAPHLLPLVEGRAAAGAPFEGAVPEGAAVRILTGAILPPGVDSVVMEEDVSLGGDGIAFSKGLKPGANARRAGEDVAGDVEILSAGRMLRPQDLALAAVTGIGSVRVRRPLRVGVLSTGDEIRPAGSEVAAHQIHDANRPMLLDLARRWGMVPVDLGHAEDGAEAVAAALDRGAAEADAVLTTGGASAGDEDHVSRVLRERGDLRTWRIAVKPGRPLALARWNGVPVFGLPGNPVAAFVCALVFARPALGLMAGEGWRVPTGLMLPAAFSKSKKAGRREYLRARLDAEGRVEVFASEGSGRVSGLVWAEGLVELADEAREVSPGDPVRYVPFTDYGL